MASEPIELPPSFVQVYVNPLPVTPGSSVIELGAQTPLSGPRFGFAIGQTRFTLSSMASSKE